MNEINHVDRDTIHYDSNLRLNSPNENALFLAYLLVNCEFRCALKRVANRPRKSPKQKDRAIRY